MRIESRLLIAISLLLFAVGLDVSPSSGQEKKSIRFVTVSLGWNAALPFRVTIARGLFKQQGLQVEPIVIRGGPAAIAALASGEVDFAGIGGAQAVFRSRARGLDLTIIGCTSSTTNYLLLGHKKIRTVEDLKGKIIGTTGAGSFSDFAVRTFLKKHNINPDKDVFLAASGTHRCVRRRSKRASSLRLRSEAKKQCVC